MNKEDKKSMFSELIILGCVILFIYVASWSVSNAWQHDTGLMEYCKENGFDGMRYETVGFLTKEPRCAMSTIEEEYRREKYGNKSKEFNEAAEDVLNALVGKPKFGDDE